MLVLIVEDDERVGQFLYRGLREEGYKVDLCETAADAEAQGLAQPYDVVLLDWMLPDADGLTVLRHWREGGMSAPVIMLTARTGVDATVLALDSGADDYIEKPFSFEELLARLRAQTRRAHTTGSAPHLVQVGSARVDLRSRAVSRGGEDFELTGREFELLDHFLKHRGETLGRARILDRVWGMSHDPTTNVVDVYVRYLRNKLDPDDLADNAESVIQTVRGRGYRLRPQNELDEQGELDEPQEHDDE
jgi:DNA-binding response OmpR family regulator